MQQGHERISGELKEKQRKEVSRAFVVMLLFQCFLSPLAFIGGEE